MVSALVPGSSGPGSSPGLEHLCCILGQDTLLSQCLSPPRSINGYQRIVEENLTNCWGVSCDGLASLPGGVEVLLAASCYGNQDKPWPNKPVGSKRLHFTTLIHQENKALWETLFKLEEFENAAFPFKCGPNTFWKTELF